MPNSLSGFFNPKSIAVIGASNDKYKVGSVVFKNILDSKYSGKLYAVNPNESFVHEIKSFPKVGVLPDVVDLAIIAVPAIIALKVLEEVGQMGIKNVLIYSSGFKEIGDLGNANEKSLMDLISKFSFNVLGPNCFGFINQEINLNTTFGPNINYLGQTKFISQSGALASSLFDFLNSVGVGISEFISLGNKTGISEIDILEEYASNSYYQNSRFPIALYLESISDGVKFKELTSKLSKTHPIVILKPGKSTFSISAMKSHTGSMTGSQDVFESLAKKHGLINCKTLEEFFLTIKTLEQGYQVVSDELIVLTNAGGAGVVIGDAVNDNSLRLSNIQEIKTDLESALVNVSNPIDLLGDASPQKYLNVLEILGRKKIKNPILCVLTPQINTQVLEIAQTIIKNREKYQLNLFCSFIGKDKIKDGVELLNRNHIPVFEYPEQAVKIIKNLYGDFLHKSIPFETPDFEKQLIDTGKLEVIKNKIKKLGNNYISLDILDSEEMIQALGMNVPSSAFITNLNECLDFVNNFKYPVVLKISANNLIHKKVVGGVFPNIDNEEMLRESFEKISQNLSKLDLNQYPNPKIQIQKEIKSGLEVILGVKKDSDYGEFLLFGAGGSDVELIKDKNLALLPLNMDEILNLIKSSKIYNSIKEQNISIYKLAQTILNFAKIGEHFDDLSGIEINPLIISENNFYAVDTKVLLVKPKILEPQKNNSPFKKAKLVSKINLARKFFEFEFETQETFISKPGQFITVKIDAYQTRAYSLASIINNQTFSLLVDTKPGGPGSIYFENLQIGDSVEFIGPSGQFIPNPITESENILFFATGSGMSPFRYMFDYFLKEVKTAKKIKLYFGLTFEDEIFWQDYLDNLKNEYSNFDYEIAIKTPSDNWKGKSGFITDLFNQDFSDASNCDAYLCGHPAMIDSCTKALILKGCKNENIHMEKYS